jgi:hypothetical protein
MMAELAEVKMRSTTTATLFARHALVVVLVEAEPH